MRTNGSVVALVVLVLFAACTAVPTEPHVVALPGTGKTLVGFGADDAACRKWATERVASERGGSPQRQFDVAYMQCMYVHGNQVPVPRAAAHVAPSGKVERETPLPPGVPPPPPGEPPPPPPDLAR